MEDFNYRFLRFVTYRTACNRYYFNHCKSIVNQQSCIFYILWCNQCITDIAL